MSEQRDWRDRKLVWRMFTSLAKLNIVSSKMSDLCTKEEYDFFIKKFSIRERDPSIKFLPRYHEGTSIVCGLAVDIETREVVYFYDESPDGKNESCWSYGFFYYENGQIFIDCKVSRSINMLNTKFVCPHKDMKLIIDNYLDELILKD